MTTTVKSASDEEDLRDFCPNCGSVGYPTLRVSGSTFTEVLLWLFFLVPGIIYSIWRASTKRLVCSTCDHAGTIPIDSPVAQAALAKLGTSGSRSVEQSRSN